MLKQNKSNYTTNLKNVNIRKDRIGTLILKGKKKHLVTFNDQIGDVLIDIKYIESYKKYNVRSKNIIVDSCSCVLCHII